MCVGSLPPRTQPGALNVTLLPWCAEECGGPWEKEARVPGGWLWKTTGPRGHGSLCPSAAAPPAVCRAGSCWDGPSRAAASHSPRLGQAPSLPATLIPGGSLRGRAGLFSEGLPSLDGLSILRRLRHCTRRQGRAPCSCCRKGPQEALCHRATQRWESGSSGSRHPPKHSRGSSQEGEGDTCFPSRAPSRCCLGRAVRTGKRQRAGPGGRGLDPGGHRVAGRRRGGGDGGDADDQGP